MAVKYRIMAINLADVDYLDQIKDRDVQVILDQERNAFDTWQRKLQSVGDDAGVFMEDDVILCDNFRDEIEKVIEQYPDMMISFFTLRKIDRPTLMRGADFCMNQCYYLPKGMAKAIYEYSINWIKSERGKAEPTAYDYCMGDWLKMNKLKYILWSPSLVQHKQQKSRINPRRSSKRQAKNFKGGKDGNQSSSM